MKRLVAGLVVVLLAADVALGAVEFFHEDFNGRALGSNLIDADNAYGVSGGVARIATSGGLNDRHYVTTVATNYNSLDFVAELTFSLTNTADSSTNIVFFGIGSGLRDGSFFNEPEDAIFFRFHALNDPNPPFRGAADVASNPAGNGFDDATYFELRSLVTENTIHRARIEKIGNTISFSVDDNFNGVFSADLSLQIDDLAAVAPYLNDSNSRVFFGTALTLDSFDEITVRAIPEPASLAVWSLLCIVGIGIIRRRRR